MQKQRRLLIINADGYGLTKGVSRAIEECIAFGTVRSLSANVNFPGVESVRGLLSRHPDLSVGCHLNPVVGPPVLPASEVPSLVGDDGEFHNKDFESRMVRGRIRLDELKKELLAQIDRTRDLAGAAFSHVDFHKGFHRLPQLYGLFLEIARASGTGRIRTHRYRVGMEGRHPRRHHWIYVLSNPSRTLKYAWNVGIRWHALSRGFRMPDSWVQITQMGLRPERITLDNYSRMLTNLRPGIHEFVAHPGHVDPDLSRYSTYLEERDRERRVLCDERFRAALRTSGVVLAGYRDIPIPPRRADGLSPRPSIAPPEQQEAK